MLENYGKKPSSRVHVSKEVCNSRLKFTSPNLRKAAQQGVHELECTKCMKLKCPPGRPGQAGRDGEPGVNGKKGTSGKSGMHGLDFVHEPEPVFPWYIFSPSPH
ncbi:unnamed protein product [Anisakis simplex]|uniref:Collagen triple helix repeat protein n=1 Tax=Anisakis simplex TaxID=6269 RepID=A0A0M3JK14_ANISI|nr:unnamed protein product [Anisakis simplex]